MRKPLLAAAPELAAIRILSGAAAAVGELLVDLHPELDAGLPHPALAALREAILACDRAVHHYHHYVRRDLCDPGTLDDEEDDLPF